MIPESIQRKILKEISPEYLDESMIDKNIILIGYKSYM